MLELFYAEYLTKIFLPEKAKDKLLTSTRANAMATLFTAARKHLENGCSQNLVDKFFAKKAQRIMSAKTKEEIEKIINGAVCITTS